MQLSEIYNQSQLLTPFPCGVYFLFNDSDLVYIGKSVNPFGRLSEHAKNPEKVFNRWSLIECDERWLDWLESQYIRRFRPPFNARNWQWDGYVKTPFFKRTLDVSGYFVHRVINEYGIPRRKDAYDFTCAAHAFRHACNIDIPLAHDDVRGVLSNA